MDEFRTLPLASQSVQNFVAFTTRRASIAEFYKSCIALVEFLDVFLQEPEQLYPDFNERHALLEHLRTIRFSFATIHQCISKRRFPTNFSQLWPYLGIPIREVSQNLGVSVSVLKSRCIELRKKWPKPSNTYRVLVAVQVFVRHLGRVNARKLFRLRRRLTLKQIHIRLRYQFEISEEMRSFLYCEIKGRRYGPLRNSQQWVEVLGHDNNDYRVNLLLVVSEQRNTQNQRQQLENVQLAPSSADVAPAPEVTNSAQNRTRTLMGALHQSNYGANPLKNSTCLTFSTTFTEVQGRVLEPPKLKFGWRVLDMVQSIKGFAYDGEKTLSIIEFPVVLENLSSNRTKAIFDALQGHELEQFNEAVRVLYAAKQGWFLVRQCFFHNDPKNSIGIDGGVVGCREFHSSLLGLISQIVKIQLLASVDFKKTPELAEMVEDSKEAEELMGLAPEKVLLKWMNYQLKKAGYKKEVTNFSSDLKDGEAYAHLLNVLAPEHGSTKTLETKDPTERANLIIEQAEKLDCKRYVTSKDIVEGSTNLNLAFVAQIFHHRNGLTMFAEMMSDDESTSREERCFRMWIKKLIIAFLWQLMRFSMLQLLRNLRTHGQGKEINDADILQWANMKVKQCGKTKKDSFKDKRLSDGIFFLELLSAVQKRVVNWGLVTKGETFLVEITDEDKKLNAMYIISVARKLGCSIFLLLEDILESLHEPCSVIEVNYAPVRVDMFDTIKRALPGPPLFLLCILPERKNSDIYGSSSLISRYPKRYLTVFIFVGPWKRKCLVDFGIVTQCNLLLKINAKMGGTNSLLYDEYLHSIPLVSRTPTIIFGMDASIAAAVSSRQWPLISRYGASVSAQSARVEMIDGLFKPVAGKDEEMIRALLDDYYTSTQAASEDAFRLVVPEYKAKEQLQERLLLAIH